MTPKSDREKAEQIAVKIRADGVNGYPMHTSADYIYTKLKEVKREVVRELEEMGDSMPYKICLDKYHDERYCSTCEAMKDGIDFIIDKFKKALE